MVRGVAIILIVTTQTRRCCISIPASATTAWKSVRRRYYFTERRPQSPAVGVNTPEVSGRNKSAESGGERAKQWLKSKLEQRKVFLQGDVEKQDKYQRTLAYVYDENKQLVNLELVKTVWRQSIFIRPICDTSRPCWRHKMTPNVIISAYGRTRLTPQSQPNSWIRLITRDGSV